MSEAKFPFSYYPDPTKGRPVFNGKLYFGEPCTDPKIVENQIDVYAIDECCCDQTPYLISQPISTNAGGVPVGPDGSPVKLVINQDYSITVDNKSGTSVYHTKRTSPNASIKDIALGGNAVFKQASDLTSATTKDGALDLATIQAMHAASTKVNTESFYLGKSAGKAEYNILTDAEKTAKGFDGTEGYASFSIDLGSGATGYHFCINVSKYVTLLTTQVGAVHDDGGVTDSSLAVKACEQLCLFYDTDMGFQSGTYKIAQKIVWNPQHFSIRGFGIVEIVSTTNADSLLFEIEGDSTSGGRIWYSNATELSNFVLNLSSSVSGFKIGSITPTHETPAVTVRNVHVNEAQYGVQFNSDTWIVRFEHCFFRNNSYSIRFNTLVNAGENLVFDHCTFSGTLNSVIRHQTGTVECTFSTCSFDYNNAIINEDQLLYRAIFRFTNGCHFEDNGSTTQFDFATAGNTYYLDFDNADWYYTGDIPDMIMDISSSGSQNTVVTIDKSKFPVFQTSQDRSASSLFQNQDRNVKFVIGKGNIIESANNLYFEVLNRNNNLYPPLETAYLPAADGGNDLFAKSGAGAIVQSADVPTWSYTSTSFYSLTTNSWWTSFDCDHFDTIRVSGNIKRNEGAYAVQVRYFDRNDTQISVENLGLPGTLGSWQRFGQKFNPPLTTAYARVQLSGSGATGAGECYVNDIVVELA